ncbi:MAG: hypothetical protein RJA31_1163, partial [Actinomycetota bacterium]
TSCPPPSRGRAVRTAARKSPSTSRCDSSRVHVGLKRRNAPEGAFRVDALGSASGASSTTLECATLVLAESTPHARVLVGLECVLEAGHPPQTAFAFSIWSRAGPVLPTGKKSSGSTVRQADLSRQSMVFSFVGAGAQSSRRIRPSEGRRVGDGGVGNCALLRAQTTSSIRFSRLVTLVKGF